jgi:hypothetical protein
MGLVLKSLIIGERIRHGMMNIFHVLGKYMTENKKSA